MGESMAYSARATPALVALCQAAYADLAVFGWLLAGTHHTETYQGGVPLAEAQAARRRVTKQPFFVNYWWGDKVLAACRPEGSRASEYPLEASKLPMISMAWPSSRRLLRPVTVTTLRPFANLCSRLPGGPAIRALSPKAISVQLRFAALGTGFVQQTVQIVARCARTI